MSSSAAGCCDRPACACADWLTTFCDYVPLTHKYCGTTTEFASGRSKSMPAESIRPESGVYAADRQFEISMEEHEVESGIGAVIVDADGEEWQVYRAQEIKAFCLKRLWARNIAVCFALLDQIEVFEMENCGDDCSEAVKPKRIGRLRGKILVDGGSAGIRDDSDEMDVQYSASLVSWPFGDYPLSSHRLKTKKGWFRVRNFSDGGPFVPYSLSLEKIRGECDV